MVKAGQSALVSVSVPVHESGPSASLTTTVVVQPAWYSWEDEALTVVGSIVAKYSDVPAGNSYPLPGT